MEKVVAVAMSGGVDSSLTAAMLLEQGYKVFGITLRLWVNGADPDDVPLAVTDAKKMCDFLGIEHHVVDARLVQADHIGVAGVVVHAHDKRLYAFERGEGGHGECGGCCHQHGNTGNRPGDFTLAAHRIDFGLFKFFGRLDKIVALLMGCFRAFGFFCGRNRCSRGFLAKQAHNLARLVRGIDRKGFAAGLLGGVRTGRQRDDEQSENQGFHGKLQ